RDTDVMDARAPRTNQAIVGTLSLLALITGWWPILGVLAGQLAIGLVFGRRYCLPCLLYCEVIQPRVGEGRIEDSRPPRFANIVGAVFLGAATIAYLVGLNAIGLVLGSSSPGSRSSPRSPDFASAARSTASRHGFAVCGRGASIPSTSSSSVRRPPPARSSSSLRTRSARTAARSRLSSALRAARSSRSTSRGGPSW